MKTTIQLSSVLCRVFIKPSNYAPLLAGLFLAHSTCAAPRNPPPPFPESAPLYHESFDEDWFPGKTNGELSISGLGLLDESWSGFSLTRVGESVIPFIVPALNGSGHTNMSSDT